MKEDFLHYIWKHELFDKKLIADTHEKIEVLSTGQHNLDAGPDFINARIKINDTIWAGNIEIHTDSANWNNHKHQLDPAYNNVILHVVKQSGKKCYRQNGEIVPTAELKYNSSLYKNYIDIISSSEKIPCHNDLNLTDGFIVKLWLDSLCIDRIESKTQQIEQILHYTNNSWEETFYIILARNFGFKTNALPFELLAKSIPLKMLAKYSSNLLQLEALLFGQAGFLEEDSQSEYHRDLKKEYTYLKKIHNLNPIEKHLWKFLRLRPSNFPTIRIAQFASLVNKSKHLFSKTLEANNIKELTELFACYTSNFWENHYTFNKVSPKKVKNLGKLATNGIFINTVVPFIFIYGKNRLKPELKDKALNILNQLPAEKNSIIKKWKEIGLEAKNAAESQALIHLTINYCISKNCLYCQIGNDIIRKKN